MTLFEKLAGYFAHQEETRLMWPPVFLGLGAALYFALMSEPSFYLAGGFLTGALLLWVRARRFYHRKSENEIRFLLYLLFSAVLLTACGFSCAKARGFFAGTPMIVKETRPVKITAMLSHIEDRGRKSGRQVLLEDVSIETWEEKDTPEAVRLTVRTEINDDVAVGDRVSLLAKLTPPAVPVLPDSFDYARHFYFEGIGGLGFALSGISLVEKGQSAFPGLEHVRMRVSDKIKHHVKGPAQGIVVALMTGERAAIDDGDWQALRASGLAHIISISGLHVAMVAAPVFFLVRLLLALIPAVALRFDIKKIAAFCALLVCSAYVGFVVPTVPTTRSLLMTGVALIAIMMDRSPFSMRLVGFSAILLLVFTPESVWSASFQMSFAAVAALVFVADVVRPVWLRLYREAGLIRKSVLYICGAALTSFVASVATAPFVWFHFQQMASYSVLGNLLAMPISGLVIMPMMMAAYVLMPFGLDHWPLTMMAWGVDGLLEVARYVQNLPGALITGRMVSPLFLYGSAVSGLIVILFARWWKVMALPVFVSAVIAAFMTPLPDILIAPGANIMAVRTQEGYAVSSLRKERFVRKQWAQHLDFQDFQLFPEEGVMMLSGQDQVSCDRSLCRIEVDGMKISYGESYTALLADCGWADLLVTTKWLDRTFCPQARVFDARHFRRNGAVAVFAQTRKIDMARNHRGFRPWTGNQAGDQW